VESPDPENEGKNRKTNSLNEIGRFVGSGIELASILVVMYFIGTWVDSAWDTKPWGMVSCLFIGAAGGLIRFIRDVLDYSKKEMKK